MAEALRQHPMTCCILVLYASNVCWYASQRWWGLAVYWTAAFLITVSTTWLIGWRG